ncbi:MAG: DNA-processing protein DprA [Chloroflexota bacterium]
MPLDEAWIALSLVPRIGNKTIDALLSTFGSSDAILSASQDDLITIRGIGKKTAQAIHELDRDAFRRALDTWQAAGIQIITRDDPNYPVSLREIPDPPLTLFVRGTYQPEQWQPAVAVVGTRQPTPMSLAIARQLGTGYAEKGWTVISGLALGIDSAGHQGALVARTTPTLAILGSGVLNIYPSENYLLAEQILDRHGALISENAPDATPLATRLVTRNRIISGLCQRVIVVQTDSDGGAMHAAKASLAQGRDLFTMDWQFTGNQALLDLGAQPIKPHQLMIPSAR